MRDYGFSLQGLYNVDSKWGVGLRAEYASGSGDSFEGEEVVPREEDFARAERYRLSPMLVYRPSAHSRLRLQYNWDRSDYGSGNGSDTSAHSVWLSFELMLGKHPYSNASLGKGACDSCGHHH